MDSIISKGISIIGAGNMAWHLAHAFRSMGIPVVQIINRSQDAGKALAERTGATSSPIDAPLLPCGIVLICVSDSAIASIADKLRTEAVVAHTCGSVDLDAIKACAPKTGVFYPLQTFSKAIKPDFSRIPFCIEASDAKTSEQLNQLAAMLSPNVQQVDSAQRKILHLAAVFTCNFTNHIYAIAEDLCKKNQLDFDLLRPLMEETVRKALVASPSLVQTGPAIRKNTEILKLHSSMLDDFGVYQKLYNFMSDSIQDMHHPQLPKDETNE